MTGTERAALRLALGVLRRSCFDVLWPECDADAGVNEDIFTDAFSTLYTGGGAAFSLYVSAEDALRHTPQRLLRARLALYLRAVLRADAGDRGRWWTWDVIGLDGKVKTYESPKGPKPVSWQTDDYAFGESWAREAARARSGAARVSLARPLWLDARSA